MRRPDSTPRRQRDRAPDLATEVAEPAWKTPFIPERELAPAHWGKVLTWLTGRMLQLQKPLEFGAEEAADDADLVNSFLDIQRVCDSASLLRQHAPRPVRERAAAVDLQPLLDRILEFDKADEQGRDSIKLWGGLVQAAPALRPKVPVKSIWNRGAAELGVPSEANVTDVVYPLTVLAPERSTELDLPAYLGVALEHVAELEAIDVSYAAVEREGAEWVHQGGSDYARLIDVLVRLYPEQLDAMRPTDQTWRRLQGGLRYYIEKGYVVEALQVAHALAILGATRVQPQADGLLEIEYGAAVQTPTLPPRLQV